MEISTDRERLDRDLIHSFISTQAYWARGRTREVMDRAIDNSTCFGAYAPDGAQLAFARAVTDCTLFAYIADVFVVPEARGHGIGKALVQALVSHPALIGVRRTMLATDDAQGLYAAFGFEPLDAGPWMQRIAS